MRAVTVAMIVSFGVPQVLGQALAPSTAATPPTTTGASQPPRPVTAQAAAPDVPASRPASTPRPVTAPTDADVQAAESLKQSAFSMIHSPPKTPGRAVRLVALTRFADVLVPNDPQTGWLLAFIYTSQGKLKLAADAKRTYLSGNPDDCAQWFQWLTLNLDAIQDSSENRLAFLRRVIDNKDLGAPLRSEAAALSARILADQGDAVAASAALEQALKLDPCNPSALRGRFRLVQTPTAVQQAELQLGLLKANPQDENAVLELALLLGSQGLYDKALEFFNYAWDSVSRQGTRDTQATFLAQHMSATLDAGLAENATEKFPPLVTKYNDSMDLKSLLVEAWNMLGKPKSAQEVVEDMAAQYQRKLLGATIDPAFAGELAWFYLVTQPRLDMALMYAKQVERVKPDDPIVQRIVGAAELASGRKELAESGIARLQKLVNSDVYAAAFLAEHYYASGSKAAGEKAVLAGAAVDRSGAGFRRLAALARRQGVKIPPLQTAEGVAKAVEAFDKRYMEMGAAPEKSLAVTISPVSDRVLPGEPVQIEATLMNIGPLDVPLGDGGLVSPVMSLQVSVAENPRITFADLPMAVWPAPRYLAVGKSVQCKVRLDVGRLGAFLASRPLDQLTLKVEGVFGPVQHGSATQSWLPTVRVEPVKIVRADLLGDFDRAKVEAWPNAYQLALGYVVRDMKRGDTAQQLRAARQVGGLLTHAREIELGRADPPKPLRGQVTKPVLLTMMQEVLKNRSPLVRAEMAAALDGAALDDSILELLAPLITDPSALVRCRVAELIGAAGTGGHETVVGYLAQDRDELVRLMASAFLDEGKTK